MNLDQPVYADGIVKSTQTRFGGLNHNPGAGDGEIYAMKNLGSDYYPLISTREKRRRKTKVGTYTVGQCKEIFAGTKLAWTESYDLQHDILIYDGQPFGGVKPGKKAFGKLNNWMLVWPDKKYIQDTGPDQWGTYPSLKDMEAAIPPSSGIQSYTLTGTFYFTKTGAAQNRITQIGVNDPDTTAFDNIDVGDIVSITQSGTEILRGPVININTTVSYKEIWIRGDPELTAASKTVYRYKAKGSYTFKDGTLYGVSAEANTLEIPNAVTSSVAFRAGDAVTISGCKIAENNGTFIIREIESTANGTELHFYENTFTNGTDDGAGFTIKRDIPDFNFTFECLNRLWGCVGDTIYASKPGDPLNFNVYDGLDSDSWTIQAAGQGDFTGGIAYMGYPMFFKEDKIYRVYGSVPSNFELVECGTLGVAPGSEKSLAIAGETLFYHNRNGICMYNGGLPALINLPFGTERYKNAVAGSDGVKYYVGMTGSASSLDSHVFVYDTQRGTWHEEDTTMVDSFAYYEGNLYYAGGGNMMLTGNLRFYPTENTTEENDFSWFVEFTDFVDNDPYKKQLSKIQVRVDLEENTTVTVKIMMDSTGDWIVPAGGVIEGGGKRSYYLAIIPERADHYKMRIEGKGGCKIYSISREYNVGSALKSRAGRQ